MTGTTDHGDTTVEKFAPNGGTVIAVIGGLVVLAVVLSAGPSTWTRSRCGCRRWPCSAASLLYTSTVRPRVLVQGRDLVLRNMLSTVHIPLAAIEEIAVRQVMAVRAGGKRYVCAGVGRPLRQAMKGSAMQRAREQMGGLGGEIAQRGPTQCARAGMNYADYVEIRIQELVNKDRARRGVKRYSPEADELARQVRRELAWPEIAALVATAVFFVIAVALGG